MSTGSAVLRFFADDDGVDAGDFDRGRFCDGLSGGEGVFGSTAAFVTLLEALVRPFDVVEYDGAEKICFLALVLLPPAIVPNFSGRDGRYRRFNKLCDCTVLYLPHAYCR